MILNTTKSDAESLPGPRKAAMLLIVLGVKTARNVRWVLFCLT